MLLVGRATLTAASQLSAHRYRKQKYGPCRLCVAAEEGSHSRCPESSTANHDGYRTFTQIDSLLLRADGCRILRRPLPPTRLELP